MTAVSIYGSIGEIMAQDEMSIDEFRRQYGKPKKSKYNAKKTYVDGIKFDSRREAAYYGELKIRAKAGEITDLKLQPSFVLQKGFRDKTGKKHQPIKYIADFSFIENRELVVVDVKGLETPVFKIKRKLFLAQYSDIELRIVK